jgi:hypothetical protein
MTKDKFAPGNDKTPMDLALEKYLKTGDDTVMRTLFEAGKKTVQAPAKTPMDLAVERYLKTGDDTAMRTLFKAGENVNVTRATPKPPAMKM